MASKTSRVSARVPEEVIRKLEDVMDREGISSISECLRDCIEEYVKLKSTTFATDKVVIAVGEDILSDIDNLVDIGRVSGREEAIHHAIKTWTEAEMERYFLKREKYFKTVADIKSRILSERQQKQINSFYERP